MGNTQRLKNKVAVITGAGSGIGRTTALLFGKEGADLCIVDKEMENLNGVAKDIRDLGRKVIPLKVDVRQSSDIKMMVEETVNEFGRIDILLNNAGIVIRKDIDGTSEEEWNDMLDIDLSGIFRCIKYVLPHMKRAKKGKIISISSIAAHICYGYPAYSAAKAGILGLTHSLVGELASFGIAINAVSPGVIETPINAETLSDPQIRQKTINLIPLGRLGKTEDIAKAALFLACEDSDFITGQTLIVDGGMSSVIQFGETAKVIGTFHEKGDSTN